MELFADNYTQSTGGTCEGIALLQSCEVRSTRSNRPYLTGTLHSGKLSLPFKVWEGDLFYQLTSEGYSLDAVHYVIAKVDSYQGSPQLILMRAEPGEGISPEEVVPAKYSSDLLDKMFSTLGQVAPAEVADLFRSTLTGQGISERFSKEYAGRRMHDAVPSGLLGHSFKTFRLMLALMQWYPDIFAHLESRDDGTAYRNSKWLPLFVMGIHDLGKIWEYSDGAYSELAWASHRVLLNEYLTTNYRAELEAVFGTQGFMRVLAAEAQHHGEWEERPRTIEGYLVHLVDNMETNVTQLCEGIDVNPSNIAVGGFHLS